MGTIFKTGTTFDVTDKETISVKIKKDVIVKFAEFIGDTEPADFFDCNGDLAEFGHEYISENLDKLLDIAYGFKKIVVY